MKKRISAILLCIVFASLLCVSAFATGDIGVIGGADGPTQIVVDDEDIYENYDMYDFDEYYTDGALDSFSYYDEEFITEIENHPILSHLAGDEDLLYMIYSVGIDSFEVILVFALIFVICAALFIPALALLIVFAVLNSKLKKQIREYEIKKNVIDSIMPSLTKQPQPVAEPEQVAEDVAQTQEVVAEATTENTEEEK